MTRNRIYRWDNLKAFLMIAVVWGHFADRFASGPIIDPIMKGIVVFIYFFHMPLFFFTAGLLSRKIDENHPFSWNRPVYFIFLGYLLKIIIYLIKKSFGKNPVFLWVSDPNLPWYMFAMAAFLILTNLLRDKNPRIVLPVSVFLACVAGYMEWINIVFNLSRIIVFFPFYYLGYILEEGKVRQWTSGIRIRILAVMILALAVFFVVRDPEFAHRSFRLFAGRTPYIHQRLLPEWGWWRLRLAAYIISFLMGAAIISLTPAWRIPVMEMIGKNTLVIYFWHRLFLYIFVYCGFKDQLPVLFPNTWRWLYLGLGFLLTLFIAWQERWFRIPLDLTRRLADAVCDAAARVRE